jgi:hypothetical protein
MKRRSERSKLPSGAASFAALVAVIGMAPSASAAVTDSLVSTGSPPAPTSQNHQNEPAVAIDAHNPDVMVAGAIDKIDQQPCPQTLATQQGTCEIDNGVGASGVYFSFDRGRSWTQPTYTGLTQRDCGSASPCTQHVGPIGRIPWYYENGLVDAGDAAVAIGPRPFNGSFSWANGSRVYYGNLAAELPGASAFRGFGEIAVSRLDNPTPERIAQKSSWMPPVTVAKQNSTVFSDKDQIWADNAESSPYFGRVYSCWNDFRSNGRRNGTNNYPLPLFVGVSADGGDSWRDRQLTSGDSNGLGPNEWGVTGCSIRTDSKGNVYLFAMASKNQMETTAPPPPVPNTPSHEGIHLMWKSTDGGATWSQPRRLFSITDVCEFADPLTLRCVMDGQTGARTDLGSFPSVDIANGAPTGADATDLIVDAWSDSRDGINNEKALVSTSSDGGQSWSNPTPVSAPGDRPMFTAPALSPSGDRAYVVYEGVTSPWRGKDVTSPRPYHGVLATAPATATGTGAWSRIYDGPFGDLRATFPGHQLWQERVGDYIYAAATRDNGIGVFIDVRNTQVCPAIQDWRAQSLAAGKPVFPAPWPLADCPSTFGNTDVRALTTG